MRDMTAPELRAHLDAATEPPLLLDVREEWEFGICLLEGSLLLPLGRLPAWLEQLNRPDHPDRPDRPDYLDPARETVVICHHGIRSRMAAALLESRGFTQVINLSGGVAAWAREVDPSLGTY